MSDPATDAKKAVLLDRLQLALELEWSTLPPYLVALLSIKLPGNREAADLIRGVAMEEMLHFALVANVINALGGKPRIDQAALPTYPLLMTFEGKMFADRRFPIDLAPFSADVIETFMKIEQPQQPKIKLNWLRAEIDVPAPTIGEFYAGLVTLLEELDAALPDALFVGDPAHQLEADYFWAGGGKITVVTGLASAKVALAMVIEQGEGAWPWSPDAFAAVAGAPLAMGHYYRFSEIHHQRHYVAGDDPHAPPSGPPLQVDYAAVFPIRKNAKATDYPAGSEAASLNDAFNRRYTMVLRQLEQAINGEPKALYTAIMNGMHGLTSLARQLMATPVDGNQAGETACPTFEWLD
jgi:hypothetical protein